MHLGRRQEEPVDPVLQEFYRKLLACLKRPEVRDGRWQLLEIRPAWDGNSTWDRFLAFAWEGGQGQRLLITVNYGPTQGQCHVGLPWDDLRGKQVILHDLVKEARTNGRGTISAARASMWTCRPGDFISLPVTGLISCGYIN